MQQEEEIYEVQLDETPMQGTVAEFLKLYNLTFLFDAIVENDLNDIGTFAFLLEEDIKELTKECTLGARIRLRKCVQKVNANLTEPSAAHKEHYKTSKVCFENVLIPNPSILELDRLLETVHGKMILQFYHAHQSLNKLHRMKLIKMIVEHLAARMELKALKSQWSRVIHEEVVNKFPSELKYLEYYMAKIPSVKYNLQKRIKTGEHVILAIQPSSEDAHCLEHTEIEMEEAKEWLKYGRFPTEEVVSRWKLCHSLRRKEFTTISGKEISQLWTEHMWPILVQPIALELISYDFGVGYQTNTDIFKKWPTLINKVCEYAGKALRNIRHRNMLREFEVQGKENMILFSHILCGLLHPGLVKANYKPSFRDVERGFVHVVLTHNDIETSVQKYRSEMGQHGLRVQPHVIVVANEVKKHYFAYFETNNLQTTNCLLSAIDAVLKGCMIFNAAYPAESRSVWTFIQQYCYGIKIANCDRNYQCVKTLLSEL
ncbi:uncharacterized protein LOC131430049 [Malaya genurostris]|uniref:uncharacterized protein LOC131428100 n=1 Tax=Malaya genurostris TaxID=325434 RepID=UPI0026F38226|nr:uncharacterized protein LOC131428100 [Malaya genurostris]XP_058450651.1 uncharacterized protein LOC131430049 [Malaya genurostris]